ncbi:MAG: endonuclease/exonuclease/phosphatase family protein, partial [Limisphaerales bacterium]
PDIVAIQEFNYQGNTPADFRSMLDTAFGTNFVYSRESSGTETYSIPNGIISRFPIISSGFWDDTLAPDRGFAWARLDIPGSNDLYVVSVHLLGSSSTSRATEAANLKALIQSTFTNNPLVIVAGDFNTTTRGETALTTFTTFLSDDPVPTDRESGGDADTNAPRNKPYDYVLPSFSFRSNLVATVLGSHTFTNGLVFDSYIYNSLYSLSEVMPIQAADSTNAQHMAVLKDFRINYTVTNFVTVPSPFLVMNSSNLIGWQGPSNLTYSVQGSFTLTNWSMVGTSFSANTNYSFTLPNDGTNAQFFRVVYP